MSEPKTENHIREEVRREWREEGTLTAFRKYPLGSIERTWAIDEGQSILFRDRLSASHGN